MSGSDMRLVEYLGKVQQDIGDTREPSGASLLRSGLRPRRWTGLLRSGLRPWRDRSAGPRLRRGRRLRRRGGRACSERRRDGRRFVFEGRDWDGLRVGSMAQPEHGLAGWCHAPRHKKSR